MRIKDTKLSYGIQNHSLLIQECLCNICRVSLIVQNRMQKMRRSLTIFASYIQPYVFYEIDNILQLRN